MSFVYDATRTDLVIEHNGKKLPFNTNCYNRKTLIERSESLTIYINQFWAKQSLEVQDKIFEVYQSIHNDFYEEIYPSTTLAIVLKPKVAKLIKLHDMEQIAHYISFYSGYQIPKSIHEEYVKGDDQPFSREKTYIREDYVALINLVLLLKIMVPIWGEFIERTQRDSGTYFKDWLAYTLLDQSSIEENGAVKKLKSYIDSSLQLDKIVNSAVVNGIGSEDLPKWLLAQLLVKRLSIGDIRGVETSANLVIMIFNDLNAKNGGTNGATFGEAVNVKRFDGDETDHGPSRLESFKIKTEQATGDIEIIAHTVRGWKSLFHRLNPNVPYEDIEELLEYSQSMEYKPVRHCQVAMAQWALAPIYPARGLYHLSKKTTVIALTLAQAHMWNRGHKRLAAFLTAEPVEGFSHTGSGSAARIPNEQMEEIRRLFPYTRRSNKRRGDPVNPAITAIDRIAAEISEIDWQANLPKKYMDQLTSSHGQLSYYHEIKIDLAAFAIDCVKQQAIVKQK